jgi:hypothetical protein
MLGESSNSAASIWKTGDAEYENTCTMLRNDDNLPNIETLEVEVTGGAVASYNIWKRGDAEYEYTCTTVRNERERTRTKKVQGI